MAAVPGGTYVIHGPAPGMPVQQIQTLQPVVPQQLGFTPLMLAPVPTQQVQQVVYMMPLQQTPPPVRLVQRPVGMLVQPADAAGSVETTQKPMAAPAADAPGTKASLDCPRGSKEPDGGAQVLISVKDPRVRGSQYYQISTRDIRPSRGLTSYMHMRPQQCTRRPAICNIYLEGRCRQGAVCNMFHVDPKVVARLREEHGVSMDTSYLHGVPVSVPGMDVTTSVRYGRIGRTAGLATMRERFTKDAPVTPGVPCAAYSTAGRCGDGAACAGLHVKLAAADVDPGQTPCCYRHGDRTAPPPEVHIDRSGSLRVRPQVEQPAVDLPLTHVALTAGLVAQVAKSSVDVEPTQLCGKHIHSWCKFGRKCRKLHACRAWASDTPSVANLGEASTAQPCMNRGL